MNCTPAIIQATNRNDLAGVQRELARGADLNDTDPDYHTPLIRAVQLGHFAIAKLLIERGADVNQPDIRGWTALYYLVCRRVFVGNEYVTPNRPVDQGVLDGLLSHHAHVDVAQRVRKAMPLHCASASGDAVSAGKLLAHGANLHALDDSGHTPRDVETGGVLTTLLAQRPEPTPSPSPPVPAPTERQPVRTPAPRQPVSPGNDDEFPIRRELLAAAFSSVCPDPGGDLVLKGRLTRRVMKEIISREMGTQSRRLVLFGQLDPTLASLLLAFAYAVKNNIQLGQSCLKQAQRMGFTQQDAKFIEDIHDILK